MKATHVTKVVAVSIELTMDELSAIRYVLASYLDVRKADGGFSTDGSHEQILHSFLHETYGYTKG